MASPPADEEIHIIVDNLSAHKTNESSRFWPSIQT